jgi:hypothetical protein
MVETSAISVFFDVWGKEMIAKPILLRKGGETNASDGDGVVFWLSGEA